MRILIATGIYPPDIGGPATYTKLLEAELPKRGFEVFVLPFTQYRKLPKWKRHFSYYRDCKKMAADKNVDLIYAQDPVSVGLPALLAARALGKKFSIRVAGDYAWEQATQRFGVKDSIDDFQKKFYPDPRVIILRRIQKKVVGAADLVITPSKYFQKLVSGWIRDGGKVKVVYNGIKLDERQGEPAGKTLMTAGRLVPWKGFDFLIKLMAGQELIDWKLFIIGGGPDRERLAGLVKDLGLGSRVELLGEMDREAMLNNHLTKAGIFILNTSFESFSFLIVEAMNSGVPVIATNVGSIPELINSGKEGILVEPNNREQILATIKKISNDDRFRQDLIAAARLKSRQFSIENTMANLENLLKNL